MTVSPVGHPPTADPRSGPGVEQITGECSDAHRHYACPGSSNTLRSCECCCHRVDQRLSAHCRNELTHYSCRKYGQAWDFVLDHAADCLCQCHQDPCPVSLECQQEFWHYACAGKGAAWDFDSATPVDCRCGCHSEYH